jgi:4-hydroxybenzoate polyprenyltransferase/phosphoserine phosphatase
MSLAGTTLTRRTDSALARTICVDLDGTLIATDLIWESVLDLTRSRPMLLLLLPFWLLRGRAYLKQQLSEAVSIKPQCLPYRQDVLRVIANLKQMGARQVVLATASHELLAKAVAEHLGIFDEVLATGSGLNLKGKAKAEALQARFGSDFLYIGDSTADLPVWAAAKQGIVVGSKALARRAAAVTELREVVEVEPATWKAYWDALRPHHWSKNSLLLLPLLLAHRWSTHAWALTLLGMFLFGLAASAIYIINDLIDLPSDREHPWKSRRPFASGRLAILSGMVMAPMLFVSGVGAGWLLLGYRFALAVFCYCALTLAYSLVLKRLPLVDVFVLTSFYGIRIVTGALITLTPLSSWFLIFSMFFFFSLALAKRYSELKHAAILLDTGNSGRGYRAEDSPLLSTMGVASAFASVIVFSFYTRSPEVSHLYPHPQPLLLIAPMLLYWLVRVWLQAGRGELKEDPVTLAVRDPMSYIVGFACVLCILITFLWR